jgi:hypothetical protein
MSATDEPPRTEPASMLDIAMEPASERPSERIGTQSMPSRQPTAVSDHKTDDDDATPVPRSRKQVLLAALATLLAVAIALCIVLGHFNQQRLTIRCEPDRIVALQGRGFPPWGDREIDDAQLAAIVIPKDTECIERRSDNRDELEQWYLVTLIDQATARLTRRAATDVDVAAAQLDQALLLSRRPERRDSRKDIDRLLGDVEYWRALDRLKSSSDALLQAATEFDSAAKKRPRHATDASQWAGHVRRLVDELRNGPSPTGAGAAVEQPDGKQEPRLPTPQKTDSLAPATSVGSGSGSDVSASPSPPSTTGGVLL